MSSEVVLKSGKTFREGEAEIDIVGNEDAPVIFHDLLVESRAANGIIYLSLAAAFMDGANSPQARVLSRHRMSIVAAQVLRDALTHLINEVTKPAENPKAH